MISFKRSGFATETNVCPKTRNLKKRKEKKRKEKKRKEFLFLF